MSDSGFLPEFNSPQLVNSLLTSIALKVKGPLRFMEVCGTHTMAIFETGLRPRLEEIGITLLSGPGCPVCVTDQYHIDFALHIAADPKVVFCTFGDMLRVPGTARTLEDIRAEGADIQVVYSPTDALDLARRFPRKRVVFFAVGFETTAPAIAWALRQAKMEGVINFQVFPCNKTIPGPMTALAKDPDLKLDGFLCPGHVSVIIGEKAFRPVAAAGMPCAIAGFEAVDILQGVLALVKQVAEGQSEVVNTYGRVVTHHGNQRARRVLREVMRPCTVEWRGLGTIPDSGLEPGDDYWEHDIRRLYTTFEPPVPDRLAPDCRCGDVLLGKITPLGCPYFGNRCTPDKPVGPCMVSREGSCSAYYRHYNAVEPANE